MDNLTFFRMGCTTPTSASPWLTSSGDAWKNWWQNSKHQDSLKFILSKNPGKNDIKPPGKKSGMDSQPRSLRTRDFAGKETPRLLRGKMCLAFEVLTCLLISLHFTSCKTPGLNSYKTEAFAASCTSSGLVDPHGSGLAIATTLFCKSCHENGPPI